jgi:hypothetical protein
MSHRHALRTPLRTPLYRGSLTPSNAPSIAFERPSFALVSLPQTPCATRGPSGGRERKP